MRTPFAIIGRDQDGTTTIEFTIVLLLFLLLTFGLVEFGLIFSQYNSATKALQLGARLAAVSDPVWTELPTIKDPGTPGSAWTTNYNVTCHGTNATGSTGTCTGTVPTGVTRTYSAANMQRLVFGRGGGTTCGTIGSDGDAGMCDMFDRITAGNVSINYRNTGLGFAGRPSGPVPTITVMLTGVTYQWFALGDLLDFGDVTLPDFKVTMTGEDLSAAAVP